MFRKNTPVRTHTKKYKRYQTYKKYLRKDFKNRCGYCDGLTSWLGGKRAFHVDHFVPWKKFNTSHPSLKLDYANLVFSCPYCNISKSDKWPTENPAIHNNTTHGFIDPCDPNYNESFSRNSSGEIVPLNNVAKYMYKEMCLGLERHSLNWKLDSLLDLKCDLGKEIKSGKYTATTIAALEAQHNLVNSAIAELTLVFREIGLK